MQWERSPFEAHSLTCFDAEIGQREFIPRPDPRIVRRDDNEPIIRRSDNEPLQRGT